MPATFEGGLEEGLDRVLASQNLTIEQVLPLEISTAQPPNAPHPATQTSDPLEIVPVVSPSAAMDEARISPAAVIETIQVSASRRLRRPIWESHFWIRIGSMIRLLP